MHYDKLLLLSVTVMVACAIAASAAHAEPRVELNLLESATPRLVREFMRNGTIPRDKGLGVLMHTRTFRNEQRRRLVSDYGGDPINEYLQFYRLGIDGVFPDFTDTANVARILFDLERNPDGGRCLTGDRDGPRRFQPECPGTGD